jgi:hypothetical protein
VLPRKDSPGTNRPSHFNTLKKALAVGIPVRHIEADSIFENLEIVISGLRRDLLDQRVSESHNILLCNVTKQENEVCRASTCH